MPKIKLNDISDELYIYFSDEESVTTVKATNDGVKLIFNVETNDLIAIICPRIQQQLGAKLFEPISLQNMNTFDDNLLQIEMQDNTQRYFHININIENMKNFI